MKSMNIHLLSLGLLMAAGPISAEEIREVREAHSDGRIEFSAVTGDVSVTGHEAAEFILEGELGDDVEELIIEGDAANWRIKLEPVEGDSDWGWNRKSSDLTLYVPRGSDLDLGTVSGDMDVRDLAGPALDVQSVSGDLEIMDVGSTEIEIQTVSGDVVADRVTGEDNEYQSVSGDLDIRGARGRLEIETVSGRITLSGESISDFESQTVSGDLEAKLAPQPGASLTASSHSGTLELQLSIDTTPRIHAETYSGSIDSDFGQVQEAGFGAGESLEVDGGADAVEIEAKSFSGSIIIERLD